MNTVPSQWASQDAGTLPWLALAGYLLGAVLCARQYGLSAAGRERWFWALAALTMLVLGINKQLDLHTQLTVWGRQLARDGGWYADRRAFQAAFVRAGGAAAVVLFAGLAWMVRRQRLAVLLTLAGLCLLGLFVVVRAASFHHVDTALRAPLFGLRRHVVLELAGIGVVLLGAMLPRRARGVRP